MNGGQLVAEILVKHNIKFIFTLCGGHISPVLVYSKKKGIRVIDVRNEVNAVFAADAVSRLTGITGVAVVTAGPGVTNTITAVKNAQMAQSPLVLIGGASATILRGKGSLQDIDQISMMKPNVKWAKSVSRVKDIVPVLTEAFKIATEGVPGPVFVELPIDILYPESIVRKWYTSKSSKKPESLPEKALDFYIKYHLNNVFTETDHKISLEPLISLKHSIPESFVTDTSKYLREAKRPVILLGSQAVQDVKRINVLIDSIEELGIPVFFSGMARGLLGKNNSLNFRNNRKIALKEADLVILAGVSCDFRLDYGSHINKKATVIAVNLDKKDLNKNRKAKLSLMCSPGEFICELSKKFKQKELNLIEWFKTLSEREILRENEIKEFSKNNKESINSLYLFQKLEETMEKESIIIVDGGDFAATSSYILKPSKPLSWLDPGPFGTLGVGAGFALGAKLCRPESDVYIIYGDGSVGYSLNEFDTFVRHKIGIIALVGNDSCWSQIARDQIEILHDDTGTVLNNTDYHIVAKGFGGDGAIIKSADEIPEIFQKAKESSAKGIPYLVNAIIGKTDFRKGSISV